MRSYTLPRDGQSRICKICNKPCFMLFTVYYDVKVHPKRCLGCVVKFPPKGVRIPVNDYLSKRPWLARRERYHQWGLVAQTTRIDVWTCVHCKSTLRSPKLGIPTPRGCTQGVAAPLRRAFWAHNRISRIECPICAGRAALLRAPRVMEGRPSSKFFPWTCTGCLR
jgi:hypothetical protein